jgi:hypothetical protein
MKLKIIYLSTLMLLLVNVAEAFTIKYYNKDSKKYKMEVKSNGSTQVIEFSSSTSSSATVQTSASVVEIKTACGWVKVEKDAKIIIKDGCIKIE